MTVSNGRAKLLRVLGAILIIVILTYCGLLVILALKWNEWFMAAFTAFSLFAQDLARRFFNWLANVKPDKEQNSHGDVVASVAVETKPT